LRDRFTAHATATRRVKGPGERGGLKPSIDVADALLDERLRLDVASGGHICHGDDAGPEEGAVQGQSVNSRPRPGTVGLDHHRTGDIGKRQLGFALSDPDDRIRDLR
jgi:hypothetical protein